MRLKYCFVRQTQKRFNPKIMKQILLYRKKFFHKESYIYIWYLYMLFIIVRCTNVAKDCIWHFPFLN